MSTAAGKRKPRRYTDGQRIELFDVERLQGLDGPDLAKQVFVRKGYELRVDFDGWDGESLAPVGSTGPDCVIWPIDLYKPEVWALAEEITRDFAITTLDIRWDGTGDRWRVRAFMGADCVADCDHADMWHAIALVFIVLFDRKEKESKGCRK